MEFIMVFKRRIHPRVLYKVLGAFTFLVIIHLLTFFILTNDLELVKNFPFKGDKIYSPYSETKHRWLKMAFHLHSDRDGFSPFRSSPEEIQEKYLEKKYDLISITDYLKISGTESKSSKFFPGYEWGRDFNRKHILALGAEDLIRDFFPLYASEGNIQWTIDQIQKSGAFVVISHPGLEGSISYKILECLRGIDAVEVFSTYGDTFKDWIKLLDQGIPMLATSGDDLHYFPGESIRAMKLPLYQRVFHELTFSDQNEGEAFTRYILLNTHSIERDEIVRNLKKGNYVSVIKIADYMEDPKITELKLTKDKILAEFPDKFLKITFIGKNGKILQEDKLAFRSSYQFRNEDEYVIVKVIFSSGYIYSNPFYRTSSSSIK